jgi:alkanesulfonate monooxygenase SsuD/methylene tetrahydromethanopterin reductase-like flavin-dependent oxidoreductase (luciferase family)
MLRFALNLPNFGDFADPHRLVDLARRAEASGWDGFFIWDHIRAGEWAGPVADPWVALTAVAAATERLIVGTMVTPLPRRRPTTLARQTVTLDHLSRGRLVLGVGIGWPPDVDFADLGDSGDNRVRAAQLDEGLQVLTGLWSGEPFSFEGEHYHIRGTQFLPAPFQQPRIPIWVGSTWPRRRPARRAARWDGVVPLVHDPEMEFRPPTAPEVAEMLAYIRQHRDPAAPFEVVVGDSLSGLAEQGRTAPEVIGPYEEAGATWWMESIGWPLRPYEYWPEYVSAGPPRL